MPRKCTCTWRIDEPFFWKRRKVFRFHQFQEFINPMLFSKCIYRLEPLFQKLTFSNLNVPFSCEGEAYPSYLFTVFKIWWQHVDAVSRAWFHGHARRFLAMPLRFRSNAIVNFSTNTLEAVFIISGSERLVIYQTKFWDLMQIKLRLMDKHFSFDYRPRTFFSTANQMREDYFYSFSSVHTWCSCIYISKMIENCF